MSTQLKIADSYIGKDYPTYFIADIASNHDGDLIRAKELIHLAAESGANAAKFQNFKADKIVSDYGFKSLGRQLTHQKKWRKSVFDVYKDASVPDDWTVFLAEECRKYNIDYSTSPYDFDSVEHATSHVPFFKIGSGDISWTEMCIYIAKKNKPVFLATGASDLDEISKLVEKILRVNPALVLMQCNTNYTGSNENFKYVNLNVLRTFSTLWPDLILGFSDHTPGHSAVLGAVALGARVIEKHFTDNNKRVGPDHAFSLTPVQWRDMVESVRELEMALGDGCKKVEKNETETFILQRRCLRARRDLHKGQILSLEDIDILRPAPEGSLVPDDLQKILGKILVSDIVEGDAIRAKHLE